MATFPYLGSYGGSDTTEYQSTSKVYADGTIREYRRSTFKHRTIVIPFKSISKVKRDAIESFYNANRFVDVDVYVWPEATLADLTGNTGVGKHVARMMDSLVFTNESSCRYSTEITFVLRN
jgi:hypothetical protein